MRNKLEASKFITISRVDHDKAEADLEGLRSIRIDGAFPTPERLRELLAEKAKAHDSSFCEVAGHVVQRLIDKLYRLAARCENYSSTDVQAAIADMLGVSVEALVNDEDA